jgi:hypothetical protein
MGIVPSEAGALATAPVVAQLDVGAKPQRAMMKSHPNAQRNAIFPKTRNGLAVGSVRCEFIVANSFKWDQNRWLEKHAAEHGLTIAGRDCRGHTFGLADIENRTIGGSGYFVHRWQ